MIGRAIRFIAEATANKRKQEFLKDFDPAWLNTIQKCANFNVVTFSGSKQFADQLYSISSFYRNVGTPSTWVIYNDGSYKQNELQILRSIVNVEVCDFAMPKAILPPSFFLKYPTLLKVELLKQLSDFSKTVLFSDSDVLFYPPFNEFIQEFASSNWYIVDEGKGYFDSSYELPSNEQPLNFGFLVLNKLIDLSSVFPYINGLIERGQLNYWSDQTALHLLAQKEHFKALPVDHFVVGGRDSFKLIHDFNYKEIALRHFVGPVRHKMWQYSWKKVLGIYK